MDEWIERLRCVGSSRLQFKAPAFRSITRAVHLRRLIFPAGSAHLGYAHSFCNCRCAAALNAIENQTCCCGSSSPLFLPLTPRNTFILYSTGMTSRLQPLHPASRFTALKLKKKVDFSIRLSKRRLAAYRLAVWCRWVFSAAAFAVFVPLSRGRHRKLPLEEPTNPSSFPPL